MIVIVRRTDLHTYASAWLLHPILHNFVAIWSKARVKVRLDQTPVLLSLSL
jgi:hypothetical protein